MQGVILGLYRDNGKENGSYYLGLRVQGFRVKGFGVEGFRVLTQNTLTSVSAPYTWRQLLWETVLGAA